MKHLIYLSILLTFLLSSCDKDSNIGPVANETEIPKRDIELKFITYSNNDKYKLSSSPIKYPILLGNTFSSDTNRWNKFLAYKKNDTFIKLYISNDTINFAFFNYKNEYNWYDTSNVKIYFKDSLMYKVDNKTSVSPNVKQIIIPKK